MSYYNDIYRKRLNRYGRDFQSRLQSQREADFENKLLKSVYRVDFEFDGTLQPATLEPFKQDESRLMQHLLTRVDLMIENGTILMLSNKDDVEEPWMVYWLESMKASGYNRYIVLKMSHFIAWKDKDGVERSSWAYMRGQQNGVLKDMIQRASGDVIYAENNTSNFLVMPLNQYIKRDTYLEIGEEPYMQAYTVTGYDIQSTKGVEFVTLDPVFTRDDTPAIEETLESDSNDSFWLNGGV